MAVIATEDFSSYSISLPNGANGGSGWSAGWVVTSTVSINAQSGSWTGKNASLSTSSSKIYRNFNFPASGIVDLTFQGYRPNSSTLFYVGIVLGSAQYWFVFGGGLSEFRYNGTSSSATDPVINGTVQNFRVYIDTTKSTNNVIFYVDGVAKGTFSTNITNTSSPEFGAEQSGYGSGSSYGDIEISDGIQTLSVTAAENVAVSDFLTLTTLQSSVTEENVSVSDSLVLSKTLKFEEQDNVTVSDSLKLLSTQFIRPDEDISITDSAALTSVTKSRYFLTVNNVEVVQVDWTSVQIKKKTGQTGTLDFSFFDVNTTVDLMDDVGVYYGEDLASAEKLFGGTVVNSSQEVVGMALSTSVEAQDYSFLMNSKLVKGEFTGTLASIAKEAIATCAPAGFNTVSIEGDDIPIGLYRANYVPVSNFLNDLAQTYGYSWYVGANKDVHFFAKSNAVAPFQLNDTDGNFAWGSLKINRNIDELRNSIFVRGGEFLSTDPYTENLDNQVDGNNQTLLLAYRYKNYTLTYNGVAQTVGLDNINSFDEGYDALYNYTEKVIRLNVAPTAGDTPVEFTGNRYLPVRILTKDNISIAKYQEFQFLITDTSIEDQQVGYERAQAELLQYSGEIKDVEFTTIRHGLQPGMQITLDSDFRGVHETYVVNSVTFKTRTPSKFEYQVTAMTQKKKNFIDLMQKILLEQARNQNITSDEVIAIIETFGDEIINWGYAAEVNPFGADVKPVWVAGPHYPTNSNDTHRVPRTDAGIRLAS